LTVSVEVPGFEAADFASEGITHTVYRIGQGPPVVLMHELPGMSPACIGWAREVAAAGFSVFMPLLFGRPNDRRGLAFLPQLCISREFRLLSTDGQRPVVTWLRALCRHARIACGSSGVGVIGMCLTGNFAIALMADDSVLAPVSSQPALPPVGWLPGPLGTAGRAAVAVTSDELASAQARAQAGVSLLCLRFSNDRISPMERFQAIQAALGDGCTLFRLGSSDGIDSAPGNPYGLPASAHSVLTDEHADNPAHPSRLAREAVLSHLRKHLGG